MGSSEEVAYPILRKHDVEYVLVIFGGLLGYSGDDINKFLWMVRIAQGVWPDEIQELNYFTPKGEYRIDEAASPTMKNSLMYKMSYYRCVHPGPLWRGGVVRRADAGAIFACSRLVFLRFIMGIPGWQVRGLVRWKSGRRSRAWSAGPEDGPYARLSG